MTPTSSDFIRYLFSCVALRKIILVEWIQFRVTHDQNHCVIMMVYSEITAKSFYTSDKRNMKNLDRIKIRAIYDWNVGIAISRIAGRGGGRRNLWRLGGGCTRPGMSSLAGGTADYGPCSQNRQPDIIIFSFSQSDFSDSIWFGSYRREQVESKLQISM